MMQELDVPDEAIKLFSIVGRKLEQTASDHGLRLTDMLVLWYITSEGTATGEPEKPLAVLRSQLMHTLRLELDYSESLLSNSLARLQKNQFVTRDLFVDRDRRRELFGKHQTTGSSLTIILTKAGLEKITTLQAALRNELNQTVRGTLTLIAPLWGYVKKITKLLLRAYVARRDKELLKARREERLKRVGG